MPLDPDPFDAERLKEACGVVGIVAPGSDVAYMCYDALYALQHRGQESAGMATFNNHQITVVKDNGLVSHVFSDASLRALAGAHVIGHTRYSTSGSANWTAAQPVFRSAAGSIFAIAHNGNLTNTTTLAEEAGIEFTTMLSDSDLVAELLAHAVDRGASVAEALKEVLARAQGAFSMVILESGKIHAVRDPHGFRPLCLGQLGTPEDPEGWVVASETPALDVIGATFLREIQPGEMVTLTDIGVTTVQLLEPASDKQDL
ncbi:MAG: class II glutamine amidotransferase, partial [Actinomycetota bacterium]|nr:class II glutamine amidotransferase [Actinomycetota bacterium]